MRRTRARRSAVFQGMTFSNSTVSSENRGTSSNSLAGTSGSRLSSSGFPANAENNWYGDSP